MKLVSFSLSSYELSHIFKPIILSPKLSKFFKLETTETMKGKLSNLMGIFLVELYK